MPLRQERWEQLPNREISPAGEQALSFKYVAQSLGAVPEQYARKSHVYIFRDEKEWQKFLTETREIYGNEFSDMAEFEKRFSRFTR